MFRPLSRNITEEAKLLPMEPLNRFGLHENLSAQPVRVLRTSYATAVVPACMSYRRDQELVNKGSFYKKYRQIPTRHHPPGMSTDGWGLDEYACQLCIETERFIPFTTRWTFSGT